MSLPEILEQFRNKGFRITENRKDLLRLFLKTRKPITVEWVLRKMQDRYKNKLHKVTVYRELDFFCEQGFLQTVDFGDRKKRYELAHREHHHHFVCKKCNLVEDVVLDGHLEKEIRTMQKTKHFIITSHTLEFFGVCAQCST